MYLTRLLLDIAPCPSLLLYTLNNTLNLSSRVLMASGLDKPAQSSLLVIHEKDKLKWRGNFEEF